MSTLFERLALRATGIVPGAVAVLAAPGEDPRGAGDRPGAAEAPHVMLVPRPRSRYESGPAATGMDASLRVVDEQVESRAPGPSRRPDTPGGGAGEARGRGGDAGVPRRTAEAGPARPREPRGPGTGEGPSHGHIQRAAGDRSASPAGAVAHGSRSAAGEPDVEAHTRMAPRPRAEVSGAPAAGPRSGDRAAQRTPGGRPLSPAASMPDAVAGRDRPDAAPSVARAATAVAASPLGVPAVPAAAIVPAPPAAGRSAGPRRDGSAPITVSIGRIEIEIAGPPAAAAPAPPAARPRTRGFDRYARARRGRPR